MENIFKDFEKKMECAKDLTLSLKKVEEGFFT